MDYVGRRFYIISFTLLLFPPYFTRGTFSSLVDKRIFRPALPLGNFYFTILMFWPLVLRVTAVLKEFRNGSPSQRKVTLLLFPC